MSDYGFATYDEKTGRKVVSINSKWPIFGPRYKDIKRAFKTFHITDTKQYNPNAMSASSVVLPPVEVGVEYEQFLINQYHANARDNEPILTIPHGYGKRPLGYATISGTFSKNTRCVWDYTNYLDSFNEYPPSAKLEGVGTISGGMISSAGDKISSLAYTSVGDADAFERNLWDGEGTIITYPDGTAGWLSYNNFSIPGDNNSVPDSYPPGEYRPPYSVEIDDENVYVYRHYYWCDVYKRDYYTYNNRGWDLRARIKGVIDYAGSDFDLTIYLCPYSMEDLI